MALSQKYSKPQMSKFNISEFPIFSIKQEVSLIVANPQLIPMMKKSPSMEIDLFKLNLCYYLLIF